MSDGCFRSRCEAMEKKSWRCVRFVLPMWRCEESGKSRSSILPHLVGLLMQEVRAIDSPRKISKAESLAAIEVLEGTKRPLRRKRRNLKGIFGRNRHYLITISVSEMGIYRQLVKKPVAQVASVSDRREPVLSSRGWSRSMIERCSSRG